MQRTTHAAGRSWKEGADDANVAAGAVLVAAVPCVEGSFRAKVRVEGRGPDDSQYPQGIPFDVEVSTGTPTQR